MTNFAYLNVFLTECFYETDKNKIWGTQNEQMTLIDPESVTLQTTWGSIHINCICGQNILLGDYAKSSEMREDSEQPKQIKKYKQDKWYIP